MKTSSCKAKGRRACKSARDLILKTFSWLQEDDIRVTSSGVTGEDLQLSPVARATLPMTFEVKCVEALNVWSALSQAESHAEGKTGIAPALIFTRNRSPLYIAMELEDFLELYGKGVRDRVLKAREVA